MRSLLVLVSFVILLPLIPPACADPVPAVLNMTDDWTGAAHIFRDIACVQYRGKVYLFWEGDDPSGMWPGYHGNLYYRTYEDSGGLASLSDVVSITPTVATFQGEHRNEKLFPVVFKDRLYAAWSSSDRAQVPYGNVGWEEILVKSFDGRAWSDNFMVNAPVEPYNMSRRGANMFPFAAGFGDRLCIIWQRTVQYWDAGTSYSYTDIWMRSFDGESWDAPVMVSPPTTFAHNEGPVACVFGGKLFIAWEQVDNRDPANAWGWRMLVRSFDGKGFGPVQEVAYSTAPGFKDSYPRLVGFDNPYTSQQELYLFWRVMSLSGQDYSLGAAVAYSVFNGTLWTDERAAAPIATGDVTASGIGRMSVAVHADRIYLAWALTDDYVKASEDYSLGVRSFDGRNWGPISEAATGASAIPPGAELDLEDAALVNSSEVLPGPWEATGSPKPAKMDIEGLPVGWSSNPYGLPARVSLVNNPQLMEYKHRFYIFWRMIPDVRYYGYHVIYMKVVGDFDTDGDGYTDTLDAFPDNPADWRDSDRDGVGDNTDPALYDPDIWLSSQARPAAEPGNPAAPMAVLLVLGASATFLLRPSRKGDGT